MVKKIIIQFDDDHEPAETIRHVAELVEEGYTSGYGPNWEIVDDVKLMEMTKGIPLNTGQMIEILDEKDPDYIHELRTGFYIFKFWPFRKKHCDEHLVYFDRYKTLISPVTGNKAKRNKHYESCAICPICGLVVYVGSVGTGC